MTPNNTPLPAEVQAEIQAQAEAYTREKEAEYSARSVAAHSAGATAMYHQSQQRIQELEQWQTEANLVLNPILDWGQSKDAGIKLGQSITIEVLRRAKEYHDLEERAAKLLKAVDELNRYSSNPSRRELQYINDLTTAALAAWNSQAEKEVGNG